MSKKPSVKSVEPKSMPKKKDGDDVKASTPRLKEQDAACVSWNVSKILTDQATEPRTVCTKSSGVETKPANFNQDDFEMDTNKLRIIKIIEKMTDDAHKQAVKEYEAQIEVLKDRINKSKHILEATKKSIEAINLTREREHLVQLKTKTLSNILDNVDEDEWEKKLETLQDEIKSARSKLELKNFDSAVSTNLDRFQEITNATLNTIKQMSEITAKHEGSEQEMKDLINKFNAKSKEFKSNDERSEKILSQLEALTLHEASLKASINDNQTEQTVDTCQESL